MNIFYLQYILQKSNSHLTCIKKKRSERVLFTKKTERPLMLTILCLLSSDMGKTSSLLKIQYTWLKNKIRLESPDHLITGFIAQVNGKF